MSTYTYHGENSQGKKVSETVTVEDRYAVYDAARASGHTVVSIEENSGFKLSRLFDMDAINYKLGKVKQDELVMVTRNLGSMLKAGLTVTRSLSVIERQTKNIKLKGVVKQIVQKVNDGGQFYEALAAFPKVFDDLYVSMIKAGEESGELSNTLQTLSMQMERSSNLKKKIKGAMIYPAIVISVMAIIGVLMMMFVVPTITDIFKDLGSDLPAMTQVLINISDFFAANPFTVLGGLIVFVVSMMYFFKSKVGRRGISWLVVRLPIVGTMAKETNAARTARTLSSLLDSGVNVIHALEITQDVVQNHYYKEVIKTAAKRVEKGTPLSQTFVERTDLYPILVGEMILVGEETGNIAAMLGELAIFYETEVERKTKDLSTIIEPLLMVVIGAGVGFFVLALIAPIYSISDAL
ncbi:MAG: type II secretion system F family protein [Candidatus Paceibacteria bacterium]